MTLPQTDAMRDVLTPIYDVLQRSVAHRLERFIENASHRDLLASLIILDVVEAMTLGISTLAKAHEAAK